MTFGVGRYDIRPLRDIEQCAIVETHEEARMTHAQNGTIERKVGQRVTCNGCPGTITRVCEWSNSMVEVRLERGITCVDFKELLPPQEALR